MKLKVLFAGFGGQGILLSGRLLAHAGMVENKHVAFIPSYGPEMRGGTANCGVSVSDTIISSPVISEPDVLVAMNRPSQEKFGESIMPGGIIIRNSSLIDIPIPRKDIKVLSIPFNELADGLGNVKVANIIALGAMVGVTGIVNFTSLIYSLKKVLSAASKEIILLNNRAFELGVLLSEGKALNYEALG